MEGETTSETLELTVEEVPVDVDEEVFTIQRLRGSKDRLEPMGFKG